METIDRVIFRARHWEVFLVFIAVAFIETILGWGRSGIFLLIYLMILGVRLRAYLPPNFQTAYRTFRVAGVLCLGFLVYIIGFRTGEPDPTLIVCVAIVVIGYVIVLSFVARALKAIETGDNAVDINDYFKEIILFATFFPIGMWFLQPRLNLLADKFDL